MAGRLQEKDALSQSGVLLLGRTWPQRAYAYASLKESGADVYGVEHPADASEALWRWPGRFRVLLFDVAEFSAAEIDEAIGLCESSELVALVVSGPFDCARLPDPIPDGVEVIEKPVSVAQVVARALLVAASPHRRKS